MIMFSDLKDALIDFLSSNAIWLCLVLIVAMFVVIALITIQIIGQHKKKPAISGDIDIFSCVGGKENIKEISVKGSRINLYLIDEEKINKETLKSLGVSSIIKMSDHYVLVANNAQAIVDKLN